MKRILLVELVVVALFYHGFSEGMEWHRLASISIGGVLLGSMIIPTILSGWHTK